jgi:hypothetical protein
VGAWGGAVLSGFKFICDIRCGAVACWWDVGIRSSFFPHLECGGRWRLAGFAGRDDGVSADDAGGLCAGVQAQNVAAREPVHAYRFPFGNLGPCGASMEAPLFYALRIISKDRRESTRGRNGSHKPKCL